MFPSASDRRGRRTPASNRKNAQRKKKKTERRARRAPRVDRTRCFFSYFCHRVRARLIAQTTRWPRRMKMQLISTNGRAAEIAN